MSPEWVVAINVATPIITAIVALALRGAVVKEVESRIDEKLNKVCERFEHAETGYMPRVALEARLSRLEDKVRSPEVNDSLQSVVLSVGLLEKKFDRFLKREG